MTDGRKDSQIEGSESDEDGSSHYFDGKFSAAEREAARSERQLQLIESRYAS